MEFKYIKKLIKLGKSRVIVLPKKFLKKCSNPNIKEVIVEEYPDKLVIKFKQEV